MTKEQLEKEAEEYVKQNYCEVCAMADVCKSGCIDCFTVRAYLASAESREKRIAELEQKKNEDINTMNKCVEYWINKSKLLEENLTKAKKLLKRVVTDFHNMDCVSVHIDKTIAEAEQFLKKE